MSDSDQCTPRSHLKPSLFDDTRTRLHNLTALICQVEERLEVLSSDLPEPGAEYDSLAELRSGMDCVRFDLLSDATQTLNLLATLSEDELRARFEERRAWLVAAA
jgi:hypothetical protein